MSDDKEHSYHDFYKDELTVLSRYFWLTVVAVVALFLYFAPRVAWGQDIQVHVVEQQGVKMRLLSTPCADPLSLSIVATAPPQWADRWKAISSDWLQKDGTWGAYAGCWLLVSKDEVGTPDDVFVLVFSDGAVAQVFRAELLKKPGDKGA